MPDGACAQHAPRLSQHTVPRCSHSNLHANKFSHFTCISPRASAYFTPRRSATLRLLVEWLGRHCLGDRYSGSRPGGPAGPVPGLPAAVTLMSLSACAILAQSVPVGWSLHPSPHLKAPQGHREGRPEGLPHPVVHFKRPSSHHLNSQTPLPTSACPVQSQIFMPRVALQ